MPRTTKLRGDEVMIGLRGKTGVSLESYLKSREERRVEAEEEAADAGKNGACQLMAMGDK